MHRLIDITTLAQPQPCRPARLCAVLQTPGSAVAAAALGAVQERLMLPRSAPRMWGQQQPHAGCHRSTLPCRLLQSDQSSSHWARITPGIFITLYIYISLTAGERLSFPLPLQSRPRLIPHFEGLALSEGKARKEDSAAEHRRQRRASPGSHCTQQAAPRGEEGALLLPHTAKPPSSAH